MTGQMVGEFPGLADGTGLDDDGNLIETVDFRGGLRVAARAVVRQSDAGAVIPDASSFQRPDARQVVIAPPRPRRACRWSRRSSASSCRDRRSAPGSAIIELRNAGEDAHDLRMRRVGGTRVYAWPVTQSGGVVDEEVRLLPGRYLLWCSVADHRALGMQATLRVVR